MSLHEIARRLWRARNSLERLMGSGVHVGRAGVDDIENPHVFAEADRLYREIGTLMAQQDLARSNAAKVGDSEATVVTTTTGPAPLSDEVILAMSPEQLQAFALAEVEALGEGMPQQDGANAPGEDDDG